MDDFEVRLTTPSGAELPSIAHEGTRWYIAEQGDEFLVTVSVTNNSLRDHKLTLKVDGQDPGYSLIAAGTAQSSSHTFQGWLHSAGAGGASVAGSTTTYYKAFRFGSCVAAPDAPIADSVEDVSAGHITVGIQHVVASGQGAGYSNLAAAGPASSKGAKRLPDAKKAAFLAPGLQAEAGGVKAATTSWNTTIYTKVQDLPPISLRYDSSERLLMRKILNPRLAAHRNILRRSTNPVIRNAVPPEPEPEDDQEEGSNGAANPAAAAGAAAAGGSGRRGRGSASSSRVKEEDEQGGWRAGVKRERVEGGEDEDEDGEGYVPRSATAAKIDLTGERPPPPITVNGRTLGADELAVCDLADSDEGGTPQWGVRKKPAVELDEA